jgi:hypothetical protein
MTVSSVDLGQVCSSLMDISLQLLASVKKLEQSLTQVMVTIMSIFFIMMLRIMTMTMMMLTDHDATEADWLPWA